MFRREGKDRILVLSEFWYPDVGGSCQVYENVYARLSKEGYRIYVLTHTQGYRSDKNLPYKIFRIPLKKYRFLKPDMLLIYIKIFIVGLILSIRYRINYIHCARVLPECLAGYLICKLLRLKYLVYVHGEEILRHKLQIPENKIMPFLYKKANRIICFTNYVKRQLLDMGVQEYKIGRINMGVSLENLLEDYSVEDAKRQLGLPHKKIILSVCRLIPRKGVDIVINVLPYIIKEIPELIYIIIGDGPIRDQLDRLITRLDLQSFVYVNRYVSPKDLPLYYKACDLFVMTNRVVDSDPEPVEGFGIVFLEAGKYGKPVIGGNSGGVPEAIVNNVTGFIVDPNNLDEVKEKILFLLKNPRIAQYMGINGHDRVIKEFNWDTILEKNRYLFIR